MAWIYLAESEDSPLPFLRGCNQSPTVKAIDSAKLSCWSVESEVPSRTRLYGMIFGLSGGITFRLLIFYTADSLARISALRDAERAWTESGAAFSSSSCDSSRNAAQVSFSLKTSPPSQLAADVLSSGRLPNSGMIVGGQFYPLPKLARLTSENGGGSWPTPRAHEAGDYTRDRGRKGKERPTLSGAVKIWPTPKGSPSGPDYARMNRPKSGGDDLATAVAHATWPTPRAEDSQCAGGHRGKDDTLYGAICRPKSGEQSPGQLNPTWVEWLMGYPIGHTALEPWATRWFRSKRERHSKT